MEIKEKPNYAEEIRMYLLACGPSLFTEQGYKDAVLGAIGKFNPNFHGEGFFVHTLSSELHNVKKMLTG